jgi:N-acetylmuramoyl-L-alanine amidase
MAFKGGGHRLELEAGEREMTLDGLLLDLGDPVVARAGALHVSVIDAGHLLGPILAPTGITAAPPPSLRTIVLDPGHGGTDSGAENKALGINEKTFTLDVAKRLQLLLEALGYRVVLTRTGDTRLAPKPEADLPLRVELANRARADLFISIHFNSVASDTKTSGTEIYTFAPQFQRSVSSWGAGQGDDAERTASPVNRYDPWSAVAAHALHSTLLAKLATSDRGQKIKHLGVLRGLNCPGVLVESAFLSNDSEARKVATPAFRQKIAEGIADGVVAYAAQLAAAKK